MSKQFSVTLPSGGCTNCTNCGLCGKPIINEADVVTESIAAPREGAASFSEHEEAVVAVDLGTTTIAMYLLNPVSGIQQGVFVALNPQQIYGADVISRIYQASHGHQEELRSLITETIENGITKLAKDRPVKLVVISGNTVMQHLLLGYDVAPLGVYPFRAKHLNSEETKIGGIRTILMPGISAFIGGDIVSGLFTLGFGTTKRNQLLIDLGTNAEMALVSNGHIIAVSAAAGSAFDQKVYGTQLIAGVAQILKEKKMDETGCLADPYFEEGCVVGRMKITQNEIRNLQKAKAAVAAGIEILLRKAGIQATEVESISLAGGFGFYLDLEAAIQIGLFPKEFEGKIAAVGNTSLEGAHLCALAYGTSDSHKEKKLQEELGELIARVEECNLAEQLDFESCYISAMNFPYELGDV